MQTLTAFSRPKQGPEHGFQPAGLWKQPAADDLCGLLDLLLFGGAGGPWFRDGALREDLIPGASPDALGETVVCRRETIPDALVKS